MKKRDKFYSLKVDNIRLLINFSSQARLLTVRQICSSTCTGFIACLKSFEANPAVLKNLSRRLEVGRMKPVFSFYIIFAALAQVVLRLAINRTKHILSWIPINHFHVKGSEKIQKIFCSNCKFAMKFKDILKRTITFIRPIYCNVIYCNYLLQIPAIDRRAK